MRPKFNAPREKTCSLVCDMGKVRSELIRSRESLLPRPVTPQSRVGKLVDWNRAVDSRTRIPIPVPHTTKVASPLHKLDFVALVTEVLQLVDATEASSDDESIKLGGGFGEEGSHDDRWN